MQINLPELSNFKDVSFLSVIGLDKNNKICCQYNSKIINNNFPIISFHNDQWNNTKKVVCKITYNYNKEIELDISDINLLQKPLLNFHFIDNLKQNIKTLYEDVDCDKNTICNILKCNFELLNKTYLDYKTKNKNLIYYALSNVDEKYLDLFSNSVISLINNNPKNLFDILLITDDKTKQLIEKLPVFKHINDFYILNEAQDGVEASMWKTNIFEYPLLNEYLKILYLDCDTLCKKSIQDLFHMNLNKNILYTLSNKDIPFDSYKTFYHGLQFYTEEKLAEMLNYNQLPFNAGQFFFINSYAMKFHFRNLKWLINNWPGQYFFEQSFMNHYFCGNLITNNDILKDFIELINVKNMDFNCQHNDQSSVLHFIGPALKGTSKINFIKQYSYANKL